MSEHDDAPVSEAPATPGPAAGEDEVALTPPSAPSAHALARASGVGDQTFRLPSTALFLGLIPVFSGQARRGDLAAALLDEGRPKMDRKGRLRATQVRTYIVYSGRESEARTSVSLFQDDPLWQEGELSGLIKRQFGPSGLKHLLGIFIAAEEQRAGAGQGGFIFDVNRHLDILGYKRSNKVNGKAYHTTKHLAESRAIVGLLCSLTIVQEIRLGTRRGNTVKVRLLLDEASATSWEEVVSDGERLKERIETNERIFLRINPHLFNVAAEGTRSQQDFYTHQLRKLSRENAHTQALTLTLGVHLPIKFRMNGCMPLRYTARSFLRMAGISEEEYAVYEQLERLERALKYMVDQGYTSAFETERFRYARDEAEPEEEDEAEAVVDGEPRKKKRKQHKGRMDVKPEGAVIDQDPLDEIWQVEAPAFLTQLLSGTLAKRAQQGLPAAAVTNIDGRVLPEDPPPARGFARRGRRKAQDATSALPGMDLEGAPLHAGELLKQVRKKLGMSQGQLARKLDVTQAAISMAESGKRPNMAERLYDAARRMRPDL